MTDQPIATILPPREGFSPKAFGAITLSVKDFTYHSRYRERLMVFGQRDEEPYEGIHYEALPVKRHWYEPNTRAYVRAIMKRLNEVNPCLIEVHNRPLLACKIAAKTNTPIALHLHNDPQEMKRAKTPQERQKLLDMCDAIYCISHWVHKRFLEGVQDDHGKVHTVHSGIAIPEKPQSKEKNIVFVGRMTPNKGGLEFAKALARILPKHKDWHGYMIGGRRHSVSAKLSPYEKQVLEVMDNIGKNAHFEGFYPFDKTQQMFRDSAIVVIPSLWEEPFGRTGIEAICQGCAVITSGRGGLSEIVGDTGIILSKVTGSTIADALETLLISDERRETLQNAAYERSKQFEIQACTDRLDDIRDQLLNTQETERHAA